jgi:hypothetical protein
MGRLTPAARPEVQGAARAAIADAAKCAATSEDEQAVSMATAGPCTVDIIVHRCIKEQAHGKQMHTVCWTRSMRCISCTHVHQKRHTTTPASSWGSHALFVQM